MIKNSIQKGYFEFLIPGFIFLLLFVLPVIFTRTDGVVSWPYVVKIWKDQMLLIPLYLLNHFVYLPRLLFHKKYAGYFVSALGTILLFTSLYFYHDEIQDRKVRVISENGPQEPDPVPPYAQLMLYGLLITGVDAGLSFSRKWYQNEEKKYNWKRKGPACN